MLALRSPSFIPDALTPGLFENHLSIWLAMAALAALILFVGRARAHRPLFQSGAAGLAIVALWVLLALLFETPGERLHNAHLGLASAVNDADADRVVSYLSNDFSAPSIRLIKPSKDDVRALMKDTGIKANHIMHYDSTMNNGQGLTNLNVLTESSQGAFKTTWQLSWQDVPNEDWKIVNAKLLKLNDQPITPDMQVR